MKLYYSPLSSFSQKALIALAEKQVAFTPEKVNLGDPAAAAAYRKEVYPIGKVPVLVLDDGWKIPESSIIIEYLEGEFSTGTKLIPDDTFGARQARFFDRMCDLYINEPGVTTVLHNWKFRPASPDQLERAKFYTETMYGFLDQQLKGKTWMLGEAFTLADCSAAAALFCAGMSLPFKQHANILAYWKRLEARPSCQQVFADARATMQKMNPAA